MKKLLIYTFLLLSISFSCSDTYVWLDDLANIRWSFDVNNDVFTGKDSVKTVFKVAPVTAPSVSFTLYSRQDNFTPDQVLVKVTPNTGTLKVNGKTVTSGVNFGVAGSRTLKVEFFPELDKEGVFIISVQSISDIIDSAPSTFTVTSLANRPPTASFVARLNGSSNKFDYSLDATASVDQDASMGGKITTYAYSIKNKKTHSFLVDQAVIEYPFPDVGSYEISLTTTDNEGAKSEPKIVTLEIK